jgi:high-affinity iron transporter
MFGMLYIVSSASFLIALREGFEAALIVAIVLAFVKKGPRPEMARSVWIGTGAAVAVAVGAGLVLHVTIDGLNGVARSRTFAGICIAAGALLTWMIFWMKRNSRHLKSELEGKAGAAMAESSAFGLALVAFLAVVREGLETALFLISASTTDSARSTVLGTVAGLAMAGALGVVIYRGAHRFDMKRFFQVTGALIIIFAAGLVSKAVLFLEGNTVQVVYNVTGIHWLTGDSEVGKFLTGIFGWDPAPSALQFAGYWLYLVPAMVFFFWTRTARTKTPAPSAPAEETSVAASPVSVG